MQIYVITCPRSLVSHHVLKQVRRFDTITTQGITAALQVVP